MTNTTAIIGLSTFRNNSTGLVADLSNATISGVSTGLRSNFTMNGRDITATRTSMDVYFCMLDSCANNNITSTINNNLEKVHIHDNIIRVTDAPFSNNSKIGISLDRTRMGADPLYRNTIHRNQISVLPFGTNSRGAIAVRGATPTKDFMRIDSNIIEAFQGGIAPASTRFVDISISGADNYHIRYNIFRSTNTFAEGSSRWGFHLHEGATTPSVGNLFWGNDLAGIGVHDDGCCALHAVDAGAWSICTNTSDLTYRGFHFMGRCGESSFGQNTIKDHNTVPTSDMYSGSGLIIQGFAGDNAYLGDQACQDNIWNPTDYSLVNARTAVLLGTGDNTPGVATVQNNNFLIADLNNASEAPVDRFPGSNWFGTWECLQAPTTCPDNSIPKIDAYDEFIRNSYYQPGSNPGVQEWQDTRYLMTKLIRNPELATSSNFMAFKNAYLTSSAGYFARFDSMLSALPMLIAGIQTNLNSIETEIKAKTGQISSLDASIADFTAIPPTLLANRALLLAELAQLSTQRNNLLSQTEAARQSALFACAQFNMELPSNHIFEQNQKAINALLIKQLSGMELDEADNATLHSIAGQCIQSAGRTKMAAVAMLPFAESAQYQQENPDAALCLERGKEANTDAPISLNITPNPVSDVLHLQFDGTFSGQIRVADISDRIVVQQNFTTTVSTADIPVMTLPDGTYLLTVLTDGANIPLTRKFIVLH